MSSEAKEGIRPQDGREHRDCPSCGTPPPVGEPLSYSHPDWPMKRCPVCDLVYLEWAPSYDRLVDEIAFVKQHQRHWERRLKEQPILARLDKLTLWRLGLFGDPTPAGGLSAWAKPGPVLDVGCGIGNQFARLPAGYVPYGIEIGRQAAAEAAKIFEPRGGKVINAPGVVGLGEFPDAFFTGVSLWGYLEHESRPKEALKGVRRVSRNDAIVLIKVPNFACWNRSIMGNKWTGFWHPDHTQYFTPKTLGRLAADCGFSAYFRLYGRIPFNDYLYAILRPL
jgi:SAM-dependent methyltransferase